MAYRPNMAYCPNMVYHPIKYNSDAVATNMDCQTITGSDQKQVEGQGEQGQVKTRLKMHRPLQ